MFMSDPILVSGATGVLGREICERLRSAGQPVRALVRESSAGQSELEALGCECVTGDLLDPPSLERACSGASQVVNTATSIATLKKGQKMAAIDRDGILSLVAAAESARVENFVFISVPSSSEDIRFFGYKRVVEQHLLETSMPATILQATGFMESAFVPASGWEVAKGSVKMVGDGRAASRWVSLVDVAKATVAACTHSELQGKTRSVAGPENLSAREVLAIFEDVYATKAKVQSVPPWLVRGISKLLMPFREDLASVMQIITTDLSLLGVETPPELRRYLEPMVTVREFAERQLRTTRA